MLLKLAHLSLGRSLLDTKENTIVRSLELLNSKQHQELFQEFVQDNKARILPYLWRESAVRAVITLSDMRSASLLAVANALYQVGESCKFCRQEQAIYYPASPMELLSVFKLFNHGFLFHF